MLSRSAAADELDQFKRTVDLRLLAQHLFGYRVDKASSGRCSTAMRNDAGEKIIIRINPRDSHWEYFNVGDLRDSGSVIDFLQNRISTSHYALGEARKLLRQHTGYVAMNPERARAFAPMRVVDADLDLIEREYSRMKCAESCWYLEKVRKIPAHIYQWQRFYGRVRVDRDGNAVFPHFGKDGALTGYEIRGQLRKAFSTGGVKGLWLSHQWPWVENGVESETLNPDNEIVFCESAIDAMSHAALFPSFNSRYASIGGQPSSLQIELIGDAIAAMPLTLLGGVVAAMDSDAAGARLADIVGSALIQRRRNDLLFKAHFPSGAKDWNEVLCKRKETEQ